MSFFRSNLERARHLGRMSGGYFVTSAINNALPFLLLPVLTRYLLPEHYANVSLFTAYVAIANSLSTQALTSFIANCFFDRPREYVARAVTSSALVLVLFSAGALCLLAGLHFIFPGLLGLPLRWLLLVPLTSFAYNLLLLALGVIRNQKRVAVFGFHQVTNTLLNVLFTLLFVVALLVGWKGRVLGIMAANILSAGMAVWYLARNGFLSLSLDRKLTSEVARFTAVLVPDSSHSVVVAQLGFLLMQYYHGKELLGIYSVGFNIAAAVLILATTLSLSLVPFLFEQLSTLPNMDRRYVTRMVHANVFVVLLGAGLVSALSGVILRLMTTPAYYPARQFVPWLAAGFVFTGIALFVKPFLIRLGQQRFISLAATANFVLFLVLSWVFNRLFGHIGIACAFGVSSLLLLVLLFARTQAVLPLPWLKALFSAGKPEA